MRHRSNADGKTVPGGTHSQASADSFLSGGDDFPQQLAKRLAKGSGIVFLGQALNKFLAFGLQVGLGRLLGASGYGLYALALGVLEFGGTITQIGLPNGIVRFVAISKAEKDSARLKGTLLTGFTLEGAASLLGMVGFALAAPWIAVRFFHEPQLVWPLRLIALALPFYNLTMLTQSGLRGLQRMGGFTLVGIARQLATLILAMALVSTGFKVTGAVGGFGAASLLALVFALALLRGSMPAAAVSPLPKWRLKELLRFSLPLYLAGFSFLLMTQTDIIMLGHFVSVEEVGIYRAAVALGSLVVFGLSAINTAFSPLIVDLYHRGQTKELAALYKTATRWEVLLSLGVAMPLVLFPREVLGIYGSGFPKAAWSLVALVAFQLVNAGVGSVGLTLQMSGHQDWVLGNNLFTAALNIGLNLWWIPKWGILGAALATGSALALNNLLGMVEMFWLLKMHPFSRGYMRLGFPVAAGLGTSAMLRLADCIWWPNLMVSMGAFGLAFVLVGMSDVDRAVLRAIRNRLWR
jgi:O-antigen/teichoic acid export membrane protein